jgi:hypothetical protein
MSWNDEEKAVSAVSFISSSLWYIEDFSITNDRNSFLFVISWHSNMTLTRLYDKIDDFNFANINLEYRVYFSQLIQSILSFEAWISTEFSYISLLYRLLREYPQNIVMLRYCLKMCYFVCALSCLNSIVVYNDQFKYKCFLFTETSVTFS